MASTDSPFRWHARMLRDLVRSRGKFLRTRDWVALLGVYAAHTLSGFLGIRTIRCRVPVPADSPAVTIRLGSADFHVLKEIYLDDVYGFAMPALTEAVAPAGVVVDLGANIGLTVRLWSRRLTPRAIIAVEPDRANLALCERNAGVPSTSEMRLFQCFVSDTPGSAGIDRRLGTWAYRMDRTEAARQESIAVRTVPDLLADAGLVSNEIDLLKCDIEGGEAAVFRGGPAWLSRVRALLAEVHEPYTAEALVSDVRASGGNWDVTVSGPAVLLVRR